MPVYFFYTMVQKSQNDQKLNQGGSCVKHAQCAHGGRGKMVSVNVVLYHVNINVCHAFFFKKDGD